MRSRFESICQLSAPGTVVFTSPSRMTGAYIFARCRLRALVVRICVVSTEAFEATVEDECEIRFVPSGKLRVALDKDKVDEFPHETKIVDLSEAAAEQLGLALDPHPRMHGAVMPDYERSEDAPPGLDSRESGTAEK